MACPQPTIAALRIQPISNVSLRQARMTSSHRNRADTASPRAWPRLLVLGRRVSTGALKRTHDEGRPQDYSVGREP